MCVCVWRSCEDVCGVCVCGVCVCGCVWWCVCVCVCCVCVCARGKKIQTGITGVSVFRLYMRGEHKGTSQFSLSPHPTHPHPHKTNTYLRMKSPIQLELTSGTFFIVSADALTTKSFTDSLYSPFASSFKLLRSLEDEERYCYIGLVPSSQLLLTSVSHPW